MGLSEKEFLIMADIAEHDGALTQRGIAERTGMSVGSVNRLLRDLSVKGYIGDQELTGEGCKILDGFRAKRAVFLAAGFGSRLVPVTLNTPKPLIRIKGTRIIDSLLDAVIAAGIEEIYIVRGYLSEEFDQLLYKYPMIKFIDNPAYNETNNISSIFRAAQYLENAYVLEADLLLRNPKLIKKYHYHSNYLGIPVERTDDWCFLTEGGIIRDVMVGGVNCHHMFGISYWTASDGARLADHISQVYRSPGGKERFFDTVPLSYFKKDYSVHIRECSFNDIAEIDTFNELKALDPTYNV